MNLHLDWASHKAAKYAVEHWHYSGCMPAGKTVKIGVWEDDEFKGVIIFSRGANNNLFSPYNLKQTDGCELTRVALKSHKNTVTKIIAISIKMLKKYNRELRLIISFADSRQNHFGIIYQAGNWIYTGSVKSSPEFYLNNRWMHQRTVNSLFGSLKHRDVKNCKRRDGGWRHRYLYPLDKEIRKQIQPLAKPYPRPASIDSDAESHQDSQGGASPTAGLKTAEAH